MGIKEGKFQKIILVAFLMMPVLLASTHQQGKKENIKLFQENTVLQDAVNRIEKRKQQIRSEIAQLEYKVVVNQKVVHQLEGQEVVKEDDLNSLSKQLAVLNEERENAIDQYQIILLEEYKNRDYKSKLYFLASSSSLSELVNRISHLNKLKRFRKRQLEVVESKRKEVKSKLAVYGGSAEDKVRLSKKMILETQQLNDLLRDKHLQFNDLEKEANVLKLAMNQNKYQLPSSVYSKQSLIKKDSKKQFIWPVKIGLVVDTFGVHKHDAERKVLVENNGIDILVSGNQPVQAISNGVVKAIVELPGLGSSVIIDHGRLHSVYSNITSTLVKSGDVVLEGETIGRIGIHNGTARLHFELWEGLEKRNPEAYLKELH
ncbi:MAG: peptidoglycan DD-metalloendopeptidase family protein [Bacteroidia bacterium]|nr:peptidoglycan DD-metalloendopeptidase family protein [Bacteroidia bacterium]